MLAKCCLYNHKRLALDEASYGFLSSHDLVDEWYRYVGLERIKRELHIFIKDCRGLLDGYYRMERGDERYIIDDIDLPTDLEADFRTAHNLFSVGFDEIGLLIAGRGLEGVLRRIASDKKLSIHGTRGNPKPAQDADFYDLIEDLSRVRWKVRDVPLISSEIRTLLHYLRTIRNGQAHPRPSSKDFKTARESAKVAAITASSLWKDASSRAKLYPLVIMKTGSC